jgi:DNA mismatch endonuclease, patch repair protein
MADHVSSSKRSAIMALVKTRHTGPELIVRKFLYSQGYRYRLHRKDLPGCPDIVFPGQGKVIFVHGCFWHGHSCRYGRLPRSKLSYWRPKILANRLRDLSQRRQLRNLGWLVLVVWQCELKKLGFALRKLVRFMETA